MTVAIKNCCRLHYTNGNNKIKEPVCKPGSVPLAGRSSFLWGHDCSCASSNQPESIGRAGLKRFPIRSCSWRGLPSMPRCRSIWWALTPPFHPYRPKAAVCFLWRSPRITPPGRYPASCPVKPGLSSPSVTPKRDGRGDNPSGSRKLKNYSAWCAISSAVWLVSSLKCSTQ